ncbi:hypothetical protein CDAR_545031 [Caerostris darwini]|uniref:Ycf15 n=1 Tax=Caerostris darwini TaxID=1538125 RepID=A0AAV4PVV1_9ARAC|nr:hypothetical protein CDAR_545031 [Caerostris darwini]
MAHQNLIPAFQCGDYRGAIHLHRNKRSNFHPAHLFITSLSSVITNTPPRDKAPQSAPAPGWIVFAQRNSGPGSRQGTPFQVAKIGCRARYLEWIFSCFFYFHLFSSSMNS